MFLRLLVWMLRWIFELKCILFKVQYDKRCGWCDDACLKIWVFAYVAQIIGFKRLFNCVVEFKDRMSLHIVSCLLFMITPFIYQARSFKVSNYCEKTVKRLKIEIFETFELSIENNSNPISMFELGFVISDPNYLSNTWNLPSHFWVLTYVIDIQECLYHFL